MREGRDKRYCVLCGSHLLRVPYPAHTLFVDVYVDESWRSDIVRMRLGTKYNSKTGLRQVGIVVVCPKKKWWNNHEKYVDEKSLHDTDLPELMKS